MYYTRNIYCYGKDKYLNNGRWETFQSLLSTTIYRDKAETPPYLLHRKFHRLRSFEWSPLKFMIQNAEVQKFLYFLFS